MIFHGFVCFSQWFCPSSKPSPEDFMSKFEGLPGKLRRPDLKKLLQERSSSLSFTVSRRISEVYGYLHLCRSLNSLSEVDEKNSSENCRWEMPSKMRSVLLGAGPR